MKTFTAVFLIAVISLCYIEVDALSFNLSGGFYPGIIFGRNYSLQQKYQLHNNKYDKYDHHSNWPQRHHVTNYDLAAFFPKPVVNETGFDDNERPPLRNYGSHHRNHRH